MTACPEPGYVDSPNDGGPDFFDEADESDEVGGDDVYVPPEPAGPRGMMSDVLIERLHRYRVNDVYVEIVDADLDELGRARIHDVRYDPLKDQIIILAHKKYRGSP